jgi:glutamate dehydrogenase
VLRAYFPPLLRERLGARLDEHPLRREIVTTQLVNDMVNRAGVTFCFRCREETGAPVEDVVRAYRIVAEVFALDDLWQRLDALTDAPVAAQDALVLESRRMVDRAARWFLQTRPPGLDVEQEVARYAPAVRELSPQVPGLLRGLAAERVGALTARLEAAPAAGAAGAVPAELAARVAALLDVFSLLDVVEVARAGGVDPGEVAPVYFAVVDRLGIEALIERVARLPRGDRWQAMARASVRDDLYATAAALTAAVLAATGPAPAEERVAGWEARHAPLVARSRATLTDALAAEPVDLAALSVALRALRTLVR